MDFRRFSQTTQESGVKVTNDNPTGTNIPYTVFLITNAALGAGLLNFPKSYDDAGGILVAVTVQSVLLIFVMISLIFLAHASDQVGSKGAKTIQDTMEGMTGRVGKIICSVCLVAFNFGITTTFLVIIGTQLDGTFKAIYGEEFV